MEKLIAALNQLGIGMTKNLPGLPCCNFLHHPTNQIKPTVNPVYFLAKKYSA